MNILQRPVDDSRDSVESGGGFITKNGGLPMIVSYLFSGVVGKSKKSVCIGVISARDSVLDDDINDSYNVVFFSIPVRRTSGHFS